MTSFKEAAMPLADFLADMHFNDPYHKEFMADLYDIVNEIRDEKITILKGQLRKLRESNLFSSSIKLQAMAVDIQNRITHLTGEPYEGRQ